jgi:toxin-antitoxin system PIN domain toxin
MIVPDTNLLLYSVDDTSPFHAKAKTWLEEILNGKEEVGLCHPVIFAFIRLSTNRNVFQNPLSVAEAFSHVAAWLNQPVCRVLPPPLSQVDDVKTLLMEAASSGGNLVTDAQIASTALAFNATVHTADQNFLRFKKVKTRLPLDG